MIIKNTSYLENLSVLRQKIYFYCYELDIYWKNIEEAGSPKKCMTLDNRRLIAYQNAGVDIPTDKVSLKDSKIADDFVRKYKPINGGNNIVIIENAKDRKAAGALLRKHGKIKK